MLAGDRPVRSRPGGCRHSKSSRRCIGRSRLDMETLVWTRASAFPLSRLNSRLKCPRCGSRYVVVMLLPPLNAAVGRKPNAFVACLAPPFQWTMLVLWIPVGVIW
jgi:hypothetical protein